MEMKGVQSDSHFKFSYVPVKRREINAEICE
jgi:hypothetical protein